MNRTPIGWTDFTWNPATGCEEIGPECKHCYARTIAESTRMARGFPKGFEYTERRHKLEEPLKLARKLGEVGALVFVNSMTDPFWSGFDPGYARECVEVMADCPTLRFQLLTKRGTAMAEFFAARPGGVPANVWIGVTCGHVSRLDDVDALRQIPALVRFVSAEPLLGDLATGMLTRGELGPRRRALDLDGIAWLITGGESGLHLTRDDTELAARALVERGEHGKGWRPRPAREVWIRNLDSLAIGSGTAHYFKQWGGVKPTSAGRLLDGTPRDGMPTHIAGAMPTGRVAQGLPVVGAA
jgi:protein gp37